MFCMVFLGTCFRLNQSSAGQAASRICMCVHDQCKNKFLSERILVPYLSMLHEAKQNHVQCVVIDIALSANALIQKYSASLGLCGAGIA